MKTFNINTLTFWAFCITVLFAQTCFAVSITLYDDVFYGGRSIQIDVTRCTNAPSGYNDWTSSVKTGSCVILYEDACCQGKPLQIDRDTDNLVSRDFNDKLSSMSPCGNYRSAYPAFLQEKWLGHNQIVQKVSEDDDVAIYYNADMRKDALPWHKSYLKKVWTYVKQTYGSFGPEGGRLYPIFHANVPNYGFNSIQNWFDISSDCRNMIDVVSSSKDGWTGGQTGGDLDVMTHEVSHIVEGSSKGIKGSPTYRLWGDSKWAEIFIYDVYTALGLLKEKERWFNLMQTSKENFPRPDTYWFKNWFYPVYQKYGGAKVLNNYFNLLAKHVPKKSNGWEYNKDLNLGEFIHFFSGAAGADLKSQAQIAFKWDNTVESELQNAKRQFSAIRY